MCEVVIGTYIYVGCHHKVCDCEFCHLICKQYANRPQLIQSQSHSVTPVCSRRGPRGRAHLNWSVLIN